jgi:hypothetical protein
VPNRFVRLKRYPRAELVQLWRLKPGDRFEMILDATTKFPYKRVYGEVINVSLGSVLVESVKREHWSRETLVARIHPMRFPRFK